MRELSLHILDIVQNSIRANATLICVYVCVKDNFLAITVKDNGCGMDDTLLKTASNPFVSTKEGKKIGLGLPLFKQAAELAGGEFIISSKAGEGTAVEGTFCLDSVNRMPLGDLGATFLAIAANDDANPIGIKLCLNLFGDKFCFDNQSSFLNGKADIDRLLTLKREINKLLKRQDRKIWL